MPYPRTLQTLSAHMLPLQLFAVGLTLGHACLLAGVYFSSALATDAFVSTKIESLLYFRVALTVIVLIEAFLCILYTYRLHRGDLANTAAASAFIAAAIVGWALLASYPTDSIEHPAGAIAFISATAIYSLFFITKSERWRPTLYALWIASVASALAFSGFYLAQQCESAAACEWGAFTLASITLCLFFAGNSSAAAAAPKKSALNLEATRPLLAPLDSSCFV